jgi:hypothetical protein
MEKLESADGPPPGGSFLGRVPPFPKVTRWAQGSRQEWNEVSFAPQLLVLWSIQQNQLVPIDAWLRDLAATRSNIGLEIVAIASANDVDALAGYLADHPMPGAVGIDARETPGLGDTFGLYSIARYNLPRLLLIDVDGKVAWEGDPGFSRGGAYEAGSETFLDGPLAELAGKQKLELLASWGKRWTATGEPAISDGDFQTALPLLLEARTLPEGRVSAVEEAKRKLGAIEVALGGLQATAADFVERQTDPAIPTLLEYAKVLKRNVDKNTQVVLARIRDGKPTRDWADVVKRCEPIVKSVKDERKMALARELVEKLASMEGRFPRDLLAEIGPAVEREDVARVVEVAGGAADRPRRWLIEEYLRW